MQIVLGEDDGVLVARDGACMSSTASVHHRRGTALALLAGPIVTLAGMAATPWEPESTSDSYLQTMATHASQVQLSALLLIFGYALLGLASFTVLHQTAGVSPKLRRPAYVLAFCAATILPGMVFIDWVHLAIATELPRAEGIRVMDAANGLASQQIARIPAVAGMVLGSLLVVVCAWRARLVGAWAIAAVIVGFGAAPLAGPVGIVAGAALPVVVYGAIALRLARPRPAPAPAPAHASASVVPSSTLAA